MNFSENATYHCDVLFTNGSFLSLHDRLGKIKILQGNIARYEDIENQPRGPTSHIKR